MLALKHLLFISFFIIVGGCAISGPTYSEITIDSGSGRSLIYVYRPFKGFGFGVVPFVYIDTMPVGPLLNGGFIVAKVRPGTHELLLRQHWYPDRQLTVATRAGAATYVRFLTYRNPDENTPEEAAGNMIFEEVQPSEAVEEIKDLRLLNYFSIE